MGYIYEPPSLLTGNELAFESIEDMRKMNLSAAPGLASGTVFFTYRTATVGGTVSTALTQAGNTAAGATPTHCAVGLYTVAANGDLTKVAETANTTSLWASTFTPYNTALTSSYAIAPGQRYAAAVLIVTGAALPTLNGVNGIWDPAVTARAPRVAAQLAGQTGLPSSVAVGSLTNTGKLFGIGFY